MVLFFQVVSSKEDRVRRKFLFAECLFARHRVSVWWDLGSSGGLS